MIAHDDDIFEQACETMYNLNQDEVTRYWCEAREDGLRIMRTIQNQHKAEIAEKDSIIEQLQDCDVLLRRFCGIFPLHGDMHKKGSMG